MRNIDVNATSCVVHISNTTGWTDGYIDGKMDIILSKSHIVVFVLYISKYKVSILFVSLITVEKYNTCSLTTWGSCWRRYAIL